MSSDICDTCDRVHKVVLRKETECSSFRTLSLSLSFSAQQDKLPLSCFSSDVNKDGCCRVSTSQERCRLSLQITGRYSSKAQGDIGTTPGIQQFTRSMSFTSQLSKPKNCSKLQLIHVFTAPSQRPAVFAMAKERGSTCIKSAPGKWWRSWRVSRLQSTQNSQSL